MKDNVIDFREIINGQKWRLRRRRYIRSIFLNNIFLKENDNIKRIGNIAIS